MSDDPRPTPPLNDGLIAVAGQTGEPDLGVAPPEIAAAAHAPAAATDLLSGDIRRTVFWLALPVLGEQALNACVAWNDTFLAGHISPTATAAVGFGAYFSWLVSMLFSMVGIGATAVVARHIGERRPRRANLACNQALALSAGLGLIGMGGAMLAAAPLVKLLKLSPAAAPVAVNFIRVDAVGYVPEALLFIGAACLRGAGDTRTPLALIALVQVVNMLTSWLFSRGAGPIAGLGTPGIALGTVVARYVGGVAALTVFLTGRRGLRVVLPLLRPRLDAAWRILRIGLPAALDGGLMWLGHFSFMAILTRSADRVTGQTGDILYAAHIVGIRIESLSYLPAWAWGLAASTLVGQNLGARQPQRALACAREARTQAVSVLLLSAALFYFGAPAAYRFLQDDPRVTACGVPALQALAFLQPFVATLIVYLGALRGAGDTLVPMVFTGLGMFLLRVPFAYYGGVVLQHGVLGVWYGMFADLVVRATLMTIRVRSGAWMRVRV